MAMVSDGLYPKIDVDDFQQSTFHEPRLINATPDTMISPTSH